MTHEEATTLLLGYRPGGQDDRDPFFEEALELTQEDSALGQWFLAQQKFDRAIIRQVAAIPIPEGLKERLLASQVVVKAGLRETYMNWLALAASIALLVLVALNWRPDVTPVDFATYRAEIVPMMTAAEPHCEVMDNDLGALERALAERQAPLPASLTDNLRRMRPSGCRVLEWEGRPVSMICYLQHRADLRRVDELHLLVVARAGFQGAALGDAPSVGQSGAWTTASWTDGDNIYLLAARITPTEMQNYL